jgi:hypothetical protein
VRNSTRCSTTWSRSNERRGRPRVGVRRGRTRSRRSVISGGAAETAVLHDADYAVLDRTWDRKPGLAGWLGQCNHKTVGRRFIYTALFFFVLGGVLALAMRTQLAVPENEFLDAQTYNDFFSMHGTIMMFLFVVPMLEGFAIYFTPLQVGARDMPMPRLNAFGYWAFLFGGIFLLS